MDTLADKDFTLNIFSASHSPIKQSHLWQERHDEFCWLNRLIFLFMWFSCLGAQLELCGDFLENCCRVALLTMKTLFLIHSGLPRHYGEQGKHEIWIFIFPDWGITRNLSLTRGRIQKIKEYTSAVAGYCDKFGFFSKFCLQGYTT